MRISDWSSDVCSSDLTMFGAVPDASRSATAASRSQFEPGNTMTADFMSVLPRRQPLAASFDKVDGVVFDDGVGEQIGRASCRERVCQYVSLWVVAVSLKNNRSKILDIMEHINS